MTKSELIERLALKQTHLMHKDVELAVKLVLDQISDALATNRGPSFYGDEAAGKAPSRAVP